MGGDGMGWDGSGDLSRIGACRIGSFGRRRQLGCRRRVALEDAVRFGPQLSLEAKFGRCCAALIWGRALWLRALLRPSGSSRVLPGRSLGPCGPTDVTQCVCASGPDL